MIISVSRRSDIPAFYTPWILERLRQEHCLVPNPFSPQRVARVSLAPADVDCLVFWTRFPHPLVPYLADMERRYKSVFFVTLTGCPRLFEPGRPAVSKVTAGVRELARIIGPGRVVWRYDPVVISEATPPVWHLQNFARLATGLAGSVRRVRFSLFEGYRKNRLRLREAAVKGGDLLAPREQEVRDLVAGLAEIARCHDMEPGACAQGSALADCGIPGGACIDGRWLHQELGLLLPAGKDPSQRNECQCIPSRDIGMYDTCLFGCRYCYATASRKRARDNYRRHDPAGPALLPVAAQEGARKACQPCGQLRLPL